LRGEGEGGGEQTTGCWVLRKKRKIGTMEHWKDGIMGFCFPNIDGLVKSLKSP
jgi:hypothetical protein